MRCFAGKASIVTSVVVTALACGRSQESSDGYVPAAITLPGAVLEPPAFSPVLKGDRAVVATPSSGAVQGVMLMSLFAEPGAEIYFGFQDLGEGRSGQKYEHPLLMVPPVNVWAYAIKDNSRGPTQSFVYTQSEARFLPNALAAQRLPINFTIEPIAAAPELQSLAADADALLLTKTFVIDGDLADWQGFEKSRSRVVDPSFDVPAHLSQMDIQWFQAEEDQDNFYFAFQTRGAPVARANLAYVIDVGPSEITAANFGPGSDYSTHIEVLNGQIILYLNGSETSVPASVQAVAGFGNGLEIKIPKNELPNYADGREIGVRAYTRDDSRATIVRDRLMPVYLRSRFDMLRSEQPDGGPRVDFMAAPDLSAQNFALLHNTLGQAFITELSGINGIPLWDFNSFPLFYATKEASGFAGLNASDRGVLSTFGPESGDIAVSHLLAHEIAHYQNGLLSNLSPSWLQEGMSEWSSERLLYRHYPVKAVYDYLATYRTEIFARAAKSKLDTTVLDDWKGTTPPLGYEKAYLFFMVLDRVVGPEILAKAFQAAINAPMDSKGFQEFLEVASGKDLDDVFAYWVFPGEVAPEYDPRKLFDDGDSDLLYAHDELILGTSSDLFDTDGDGLGDGEEYFRGLDPNASNLTEKLAGTRAVVLVDKDSKQPGNLFRLGGEPGSTFTYSFAAADTDPGIVYGGALHWRPPYEIRARATLQGSAGAVTTLRRPLYNCGKDGEVAVSLPTTSLLPQPSLASAPQATFSKGSGIGAGLSALTNTRCDMPEFLSGYDITGFDVSAESSAVIVTVNLLGKPDRYTEWGLFSVRFNTLKPTGSGSATNFDKYYSYSGGEGRLVSNADGSSSSPGKGVSVTLGANSLRFVFNNDLLSSWLNSADEQQVCVSSSAGVQLDDEIRNDADCVIFANPVGSKRSVGTMASRFGETNQMLELLTTNMDSVRHDYLLNLGLKAIDSFSLMLARPLWERNTWRAHLFSTTNGVNYASAGYQSGVYVSGSNSSANTSAYFDYLFVEQLARLYLSDFSFAYRDRPVWISELFVHWLAMSAMYNSSKTVDAMNAIHLFYINNFRCYVNGCTSTYSADKDLALKDWVKYFDGSTGSIKTMMLAQYLDTKLGTQAMAKVLSTFPNRIPTESELKAMFKGAAPAKAAVIDAAWTTWVTGSGSIANDASTIAQYFTVTNGLYKIEEEKLGCGSPGPACSYP